MRGARSALISFSYPRYISAIASHYSPPHSAPDVAVLRQIEEIRVEELVEHWRHVETGEFCILNIPLLISRPASLLLRKSDSRRFPIWNMPPWTSARIPRSRGFGGRYYGLIVATNVIRATQSLEESLRNI